MKITKETLKRIIKEELGKVLNENEGMTVMTVIQDTIREIGYWGEENGFWTFTSGVDPWFEMMKKDDPEELLARARRSLKSVEEFEKSVRELGEDS